MVFIALSVEICGMPRRFLTLKTTLSQNSALKTGPNKELFIG